jgi:hypothetical protein
MHMHRQTLQPVQQHHIVKGPDNSPLHYQTESELMLAVYGVL